MKSNKGNIFYVRHGETDNNKNGIVNGGNDDVDLNKRGIEQAHETGVNLKSQGYVIDKIISSPMLRARHTAEILKEYLGIDSGIEIKDGLREMNYGEFKGKNILDIGKEYNLGTDNYKIWIHVLNNSGEKIEDFKKRIGEAYDEIKVENKNINILFVGHAGNFRALKAIKENIIGTEEYCNYPAPKNASIVNLSD